MLNNYIFAILITQPDIVDCGIAQKKLPLSIEWNYMANILFLCWRDIWHPQGGGSERYLHTIGSRLAQQGHNITLVTARYPGSQRYSQDNNITIIRMGGRYTVYIQVFLSLLLNRIRCGKLRNIYPDIIIDTQNGIPFFSPLALKKPIILLVHHCHRNQWHIAGRFLRKIGWYIESIISPFIYRNCQYLTVSQPSHEDLVELGVNPDHIAIARAGVDHMSIYADQSSTYKPSSTARLVTLARLVPHKQIEHSIELIADLRKNYPDIMLDIIGDGWWKDKLYAYVDKYNLHDHIIFHGYCSETKKFEILSHAWAHIMPSQAEGWCLAVTEAASVGVPSIGYTYSRGLCDSIKHGISGILVKDYPQLLSATSEVLSNPMLRKQLCNGAYARALSLSWENTVAEVHAAILAAQENTFISSEQRPSAELITV